MQTEKPRTIGNGLVPAGQYFKLVTDGLREGGERETRGDAQKARARTRTALETLQ